MTRVLLTYGWVRSSYAVLRNLTLHGVEVFVADSFKSGMCQSSRLKQGFDQYVSHYADEQAFVDGIVEIVERRKIDLIFPSHNETEVLARHRDRLPAKAQVLLPGYLHCAAFNNKATAYELARDAGVPVPARFDYTDIADLDAQLAATEVSRFVIKLLTGNSSKGVFYADSANDVVARVADLIEEFELAGDRLPQVEEYVEGEGWGSSILFWEGKKVAGFTHRRLREKIATGGTSTLREAASHPEMEAATERLFSSIGWHGLAMGEFKVCPRTGKFWFIEVNPRLWGSLPLAVAAGMEFPYLAYVCATLGADEARRMAAESEVTLGWRNRWLLGDLTVALGKFARLELREGYAALFGADANGTDDLFWRDPLVFFGEAFRYVSAAVTNRSLNAAEKGMIG